MLLIDKKPVFRFFLDGFRFRFFQEPPQATCRSKLSGGELDLPHGSCQLIFIFNQLSVIADRHIARKDCFLIINNRNTQMLGNTRLNSYVHHYISHLFAAPIRETSIHHVHDSK